MPCPFCGKTGTSAPGTGRWYRCANEHMWLPPDDDPVKPEARTTWACPECEPFRGSYREMLHHLVSKHNSRWARRELRGIQRLVAVVRELMQHDADKERRQRRTEPITEEEVQAFREFLDGVDTLDFDQT